MHLKGYFVSILLVLTLVSFSFAFTPAAEQDVVVKITVDSKLMGREMPANVYGPLGFYQEYAPPMATVYLLHGLGGSYNDWIKKGGAARLAKKYKVLVVMPEGENGWYVDSHDDAKAKYESYIIKELMPKIQKDFNSSPARESNVIAGLSMGGHGALKFGLKYSDKFIVAGSFSGALKAPEWDKSTVPGWPLLGNSIMAAYGEKGSQTRSANDIYKFVNNMDDNARKSLPFIYLDCGTEDLLVTQNRDFAELLRKKRIPHEYRQLPGKHDWDYWKKQLMSFGMMMEERIVRPLK